MNHDGPKDRGDLVHCQYPDTGTRELDGILRIETPCTSELGGAVALHRVNFHGIYCTGARVRDVVEKPSLYGPA